MPRTRIGTPHDHNLRTSSSPSRSPTNRRSSARSEPPVDRSANRGTITSSNPSLQLPSNPQPTQASQLRPHQSTQRKKALNKYAEKIYNRLQEFPTNYTDYRLVDDTCFLSLQSLYDPDPNSQITRPVTLPVQDDKNPKKKINFRIYDYNELYQAYQHQMKGDLPEDGWKGIFLTSDEIPPPETWLRCDSPEFKNFFQTQIKRDNIENKPSTSTSIPASISEASTSTSRKQREASINPFLDTTELPFILGASDIPGPSRNTSDMKATLKKNDFQMKNAEIESKALTFMDTFNPPASPIATPPSTSRRSIFSRLKKNEPNKIKSKSSSNVSKEEYDEAIINKALELNSIDDKKKNAILLLYGLRWRMNWSKNPGYAIKITPLLEACNKVILDYLYPNPTEEDTEEMNAKMLERGLGAEASVVRDFFELNLITDQSIQEALEEAEKALKKEISP